MANTLTYAPDYISPPGETLEDVLEERSMTQAELAERTGLSRKTINEIIKGKAPITPETALHLEKVFDVPAHFWNAREHQYQEAIARFRERKELENWIDWLEKFPVNQLIRLGWLEKRSDNVDQLRELLTFFGVASPSEWETVWMKSQNVASFRKSLTFTSEPESISAWLRYGEKQAFAVESYPLYNEQRFKAVLTDIRLLTTCPPQDFSSVMVDKCLEAGVSLVFTPQLKKARISGATRWLRKDLALIQLSLRHKKDDHFWFTFFHEAAHILLHGKRDIFLEGSAEDAEPRKEEEANNWAANFLIPQEKLKEFIFKGEKSRAAVEVFAHELGIAPGIVVGQLQHKKYIPFNHLNKLKKTLSWSLEAVE